MTDWNKSTTGWKRVVLSDNDIEKIRKLKKDGVEPNVLAQRFGVSVPTINKVVNYREAYAEKKITAS